MPFITIEGQPLHYTLSGTGFPVLLGTSYLWDASMWAPQVEALSQSYQVIVPELWGHGRSGALPASARTLADLAGHASRLLDELGVAQCAVVGLSVGGMWGSELALREPQRVRTLVMMDTDRGAEPAATLAHYSKMFEVIESLGQIPVPMIDAIATLFFRRGSPLDGAVHASFRRTLAGFSAEQLRQAVVPLGRIIFGRPDALASLAGLDAARTLLMCGALDIPRPPEETVRMAEIIGCRHVLVPEAGHISNLENPAFVTQVLLEWLDQQLGGRGA
ncbi:MAG: alpha/beta fold hydrolase [Pararobbsia sp.]